MKINILCLYSDIMNLYGDSFNYKILEYHLKEIDILCNITKLSINDNLDFTKYDVIFIGCGTEKYRELCLNHLLKYKDSLNKAINDNKFFLVTGNAISMFGKTLYDKEALGIFDFDVKKADNRISEEVILENGICPPIYGFLNHEDIITNHDNYLFKDEGIKYKNFYGTLVLGPILARNPLFLEYFIKKIVLSKDSKFKFEKLDTKINKKAYDEFIEFKKTKKFNSNWS